MLYSGAAHRLPISETGSSEGASIVEFPTSQTDSNYAIYFYEAKSLQAAATLLVGLGFGSGRG